MMRKVYSEILVMHSNQLIDAMTEHAYNSYVVGSAECGIGNCIPNFDTNLIGKRAMAEVVATLLIDAIASINANTTYMFHPKITLPQIPTKKYREWRESGNCGMFTIEEMYDAHCRELKLTPLLEGAIKWYTTQFVSEIYRMFCGDDDVGWEGKAVVWTTKEMLVDQLMNRSVVLALLEHGDYTFEAEADDFNDFKDEVFQVPYGFLMQEDMRVLYESIPSYILSSEDQSSDAEIGVELYSIKPDVIDRIKKL